MKSFEMTQSRVFFAEELGTGFTRKDDIRVIGIDVIVFIFRMMEFPFAEQTGNFTRNVLELVVSVQVFDVTKAEPADFARKRAVFGAAVNNVSVITQSLFKLEFLLTIRAAVEIKLVTFLHVYHGIVQ